MPIAIEPQRQRLMEQFLEYWYTVDFMNQEALQTENTRRDREMYSSVMHNPEKFSSLYRHTKLENGQIIQESTFIVEKAIKEERDDILVSEKFQLKPVNHFFYTFSEMYTGSSPIVAVIFLLRAQEVM